MINRLLSILLALTIGPTYAATCASTLNLDIGYDQEIGPGLSTTGFEIDVNLGAPIDVGIDYNIVIAEMNGVSFAHGNTYSFRVRSYNDTPEYSAWSDPLECVYVTGPPGSGFGNPEFD